ncbi:uncharacterized protein [Choristoneura fumiferana]|uniref:uncharacterized protein n=1 Tax=Choristoneura fumiferana TaxID=7141 RepID=UPI003D156B62
MPPKSASLNSGSTLVVLPDSGKAHPIRPLQHKRVLQLKKSSKRCNSRKKAAKGETYHSVSPINDKLWESLKQPSSPCLMKDELQHVTQMCSAQSLYTKSGKALQLPPLSDPLFRLPELPASLRGALADDEPDYVLQ